MTRNSKNNEVVGLAIMVILVLAAIITLMRAIYPYTVIASAVTLVTLLISVAHDLFFPDSYGESASVPIFAAFIISFLLMTISYAIGVKLGDSETGQFILKTAEAIHLIEEVRQDAQLQVIKAMQNSTLSIANSTGTPENMRQSIDTTYEIWKIGVQIE